MFKTKITVKKSIVFLVVLFLLVTSCVTATVGSNYIKKTNATLVNNDTKKTYTNDKNLDSVTLPFEEITLITIINLSGVGYARHQYFIVPLLRFLPIPFIDEIRRFVLRTSDELFLTEARIIYLEENITTGVMEGKEVNFTINGPINIRYTSFGIGSDYDHGFYEDKIIRGWHGKGRDDTSPFGWGYGEMIGAFYGCLHIPTIPVYLAIDAIESLMDLNITLFGIHLGEFFHDLVYDICGDDLIFEERYVIWPGYLEIY
jgi:hypothetical protein